MSAKNKITIDFLGNPKLKEFFAAKTTGDSFTLTVEGTVGTVTGESMTGSLDEVSLPESDMPMMDSEDEPGEEPGPVKPNGERPASITIQARRVD